MKLFVFGLGYTAQRFIDLYDDAFDRISGTVRRADKRDALRQHDLDAHLFDATGRDPELLRLIADADVILISVPPGPSEDPVLSAFGRSVGSSAVRRIVYLSTVGVYGDHAGAWIDEDTSPCPQTDRARARISAEQEWAGLAGERLAILRLAGIYGPGRSMLTRLQNGTAKQVVKAGQVFNRIHVDDAARAIKAAIDRAAGGQWNICDDEPSPPEDVVAYAAALMGVEVPAKEDFETAEMTPMARSFYATNNRISNARFRHQLGIDLAYPTYREGLRHLWIQGGGR